MLLVIKEILEYF